MESIKTRKNVSDDVIQTIVLNVYVAPEEIGALNALYKVPLEISLEIVKEEVHGN